MSDPNARNFEKLLTVAREQFDLARVGGLDHDQGAEAAIVARVLADWIAEHADESEKSLIAASAYRALDGGPL